MNGRRGNDEAHDPAIRWRPRMSIRARLTLTYALLLATMGALMLGAVYVFMRFVPTYAIVSARAGRSAPALGGATSATASPTAGATSPGVSAPPGTADSVSLTLQSSADILNTLLLVSVVVLLLLAAIGAVLGWVIAGRMLRPLKAINRAAQRAAAGELDHRLSLGGPHDEMSDLAETFDDMLAKLDLSFQAHQRFAGNASHELRTPLATTKAMLDIALTDPELDLAELRKVAVRVSETNQRNMQTVESLLDLAEIGQVTMGNERISLDEVAFDALVEATSDVGELGPTVASTLEPVEVLGDPVLVRRALVNLLDNAVRHNHPGGTIEVAVREVDDLAEFRVTNTGRPVDPSTIDSLREPFVRGAGRVASPSGGTAGHGLGLAIVSRVIEAHDGRLELTANSGGGMTAVWRLPTAQSHDRRRSGSPRG
jgi:two-component system sensor histidine kinase VanS